MTQLPLMLSILEPLNILFGKLISLIYSLVANYGITLIIFGIITKAILIPLFIKSQKSMLKQQAFTDEVNEIKRRHPDMQTQNQLVQELYKTNGISMGTGCLTSLIPLILIFPMFTIARNPLQYIAGVSGENIAKITEYLQSINILDAKGASYIVNTSDINLLNILRNNAQALSHAVQQGWMRVDQMLDLNFVGIDLGATPSWHPSNLFGDNSIYYLSLLILPVICMLTLVFQMRISNRSMMSNQISKEEKERESNNPAKAGQTPKDQGASMMKTMTWMMPIFMLWTMFVVPSALGLYYVVSNVVGIVQAIIIYRFYTQPFRKFMAEQKAAKLVKRRRA